LGVSKKRKLVSLKQFLRLRSAKIVGGLGLGGGVRTLFRQATVIREEERALKSGDLWIVKRTRPSLVAHNRVLKNDVRIPLSAVRPAMRRTKGIPYMNATRLLDYLVVSSFSGLKDFMEDDKRKQFLNNTKLWHRLVGKRLSRVMLVRKFDMAAPGTTHLAYYSDDLAVPAEMWGITSASLPKDDAKILTLWYNSTPNLIQMFIGRTETRGTWMKLDVSMIKDSLILNPDDLSKSEKRGLVSVFNKLSKQEFPSIMNQLEVPFAGRLEMDESILKALGYSKDNARKYSSRTYTLLLDELSRLQTLMSA
jgi:hypothetical protein